MKFGKVFTGLMIALFAGILISDYFADALHWWDLIFAILILTLVITAYGENKKIK